MSQLRELATVSTEPRRVELARLLASGLIRVLLKKSSNDLEEATLVEAENSADGLEDS